MPKELASTSRRQFLTIAGASTATALFSTQRSNGEAPESASGSGSPSSEHSGISLLRSDTAVVFIDPQNDVLSEKGASWRAVGASVTENKTVENGAELLVKIPTTLSFKEYEYRILAANQEVRERRDQLRHANHPRPELLATKPNELWSWDITKLLGPTKWTSAKSRRRAWMSPQLWRSRRAR